MSEIVVGISIILGFLLIAGFLCGIASIFKRRSSSDLAPKMFFSKTLGIFLNDLNNPVFKKIYMEHLNFMRINNQLQKEKELDAGSKPFYFDYATKKYTHISNFGNRE